MTSLSAFRIFPDCRHFAGSESGAMVVFGLFTFIFIGMVGAVALDINHLYAARTKLQVGADVVAHAALYKRQSLSESAAKEAAIELVYAGLPSSAYGEVLTADDITFGVFDREGQSFRPDTSSRSAVHVTTARLAETANPVPSFLFRLLGIDFWDVRTDSIYETYRPTCLREGFAADGIVDVTSDNTYKGGFCIHSNTYVELRSYNVFEPGSIVSLPDTSDLVIPNDGFATNDGLLEALRSGSYPLHVVQRINDIIEGVQAPGSQFSPDYISSYAPITIERNTKIDSDSFTSGAVHRINCTSSNQSARIHAESVLEKVVLWTNCQLQFGENVKLEDVVIVNENTTAASFSAASGLQIGRDDNCAEGGGAQLVTKGSIRFPQYMKLFGGQMIAAGDVQFSSDANGIQGASIVAGGTISGTTDMIMAFCDGAGMENNFEFEYFRLAL